MNPINGLRALGLVLLAMAIGGCQSSATSSYGGSIGSTRTAAVPTGPTVAGQVESAAVRAARKARQMEARKAQRAKRNAQRQRAGLAPLPRIDASVSSYAPTRRKVRTIRAAKTTKSRKRVVRRTGATNADASLQKRARAKRNDLKKVARKSKRRVAKAPRVRGKGRAAYRALVAKHARANGVPVKLAMAVVQVESNFRSGARGAAGEIGLMQIMPRTARGIGYKGSMKKLYNPDTNIRYGMKYLGEAYRRGGKTTCGAILKYNAGHYAKKRNPISRKYCSRVKSIMRTGKG